LDKVDCRLVPAPSGLLGSNFRAAGREFLEGKIGMGTRLGAAKDADIHGKQVVRHAWM
jgi:hypothetical protein